METITKIFGSPRQRKRLLGASIGLCVLLICGIFYDLPMGCVFALLFFASGWIDLRTENKWIPFLLSGIWGLVCLVASCWIPTRISIGSGFWGLGAYRIVMNLMCAAIVYGICLGLTGEIKSAVTIASGLLLLLAVVNGFIFQFRGNEFKPTDFFAAKTAMNVAGQYTYRVSRNMGSAILLWAWLIFTLYMLPKGSRPIPKLLLRVAAVAAAALCLGILSRTDGVIHANNWSNDGTAENGYLLNFVLNIRNAILDKPEGYNSDALQQLEQGYPAGAEGENGHRPNIVVIMSESFADVQVLGDGLRTDESVMPFVDSLQENVIRGYALTSVFGGVTANAEFEFLTGSSMAFLPSGSVPYQQYVHDDMMSIARILTKAGYENLATHPYLSTGWSRTTVYPHLGFSNMTFQEAYPNRDFVRGMVSDREMYGYILDALEEKGDAPLFLFGISMQNHGDYISEDYQPTVHLEGYGEDYPMAEQYLSLLKETDSATEAFIQKLEAFPEDTVVLFFGDHFPQIESSFFEDVHGKPIHTLEEQMLEHMVPFFIWANFPLEERQIPCTSLNYLPRYLLEAAGVELPPYMAFLKEVETHIPAVNGSAYYSLAKDTFLPLDEAEGEEAMWLNRYEILQYNHLFDKANRSEWFFGQYLEECP